MSIKTWSLGGVILFVLFVCCPVMAGEDFTGTWAVSGTLGDPAVVAAYPDCIFKQVGDEIGGSCKGPSAAGSIDGTVNAQKITFHWYHFATTSNGLTGTASFKGVLGSDGVIRGTWTDSDAPGYWGTFTAHRAKQQT